MIWRARGVLAANAVSAFGWIGFVIAGIAGSVDRRSILLVKTWPMCCWLGAGVAPEGAAAGLDVTAIASALGWHLRAGKPASSTGFDLLRLPVIAIAALSATRA